MPLHTLPVDIHRQIVAQISMKDLANLSVLNSESNKRFWKNYPPTDCDLYRAVATGLTASVIAILDYKQADGRERFQIAKEALFEQQSQTAAALYDSLHIIDRVDLLDLAVECDDADFIAALPQEDWSVSRRFSAACIRNHVRVTRLFQPHYGTIQNVLIDIVVRNSNVEIIELLLPHCPTFGGLFDYSIFYGRREPDVVRVLLHNIKTAVSSERAAEIVEDLYDDAEYELLDVVLSDPRFTVPVEVLETAIERKNYRALRMLVKHIQPSLVTRQMFVGDGITRILVVESGFWRDREFRKLLNPTGLNKDAAAVTQMFYTGYVSDPNISQAVVTPV